MVLLLLLWCCCCVGTVVVVVGLLFLLCWYCCSGGAVTVVGLLFWLYVLVKAIFFYPTRPTLLIKVFIFLDISVFKSLGGSFRLVPVLFV